MNRKKELYPKSTDFSVLDYECAYLPGKMVRMRYKYVHEPSKEFSSAVMQRGWRRFGRYYFYPTCQGCNECKSLRIDVENFQLSRSQKKAIKRNKDTSIVIQKPTVTSAHLSLYKKYHDFKSGKDGWGKKSITYHEYVENFVDGHEDFGKEVLYFVDGKLVGVDLIDLLEDGISSIYFFYDPDYQRLSLGIFSLLYQIKIARAMNLRWIYLGYWVDGCKAFEYKTNFKPLEILEGFYDVDEDATWERFLDEDDLKI